MNPSRYSRPLVVFLIGAPGSGKSTISALLGRRSGLPVVHSSEALRATLQGNDQELAKTVADHMKADAPLPVHIYARTLLSAVHGDCPAGLIIEGYPRGLEQCLRIPELLDALELADASVLGLILHAPRDVLLARITGRTICTSCGKDARAGEACCPAPRLRARDDDDEERLARRSQGFEQVRPELESVFAAAWRVQVLDATQPVDDVVEEALRAMTADR